VLVPGFSAAGVTAGDEEIVLSLRPSGAIGVPVVVNGQGPFMFLLDTGASHTTVSSELAKTLRLPAVAQVRVATTAGIDLRPVIRLEHMNVGSARVEALMPSVAAAVQLRGIETGIDGIVGQDFLERFDYTLDYRRKRLRWTAQQDDPHERLPLVRAGTRSLVAVSAGRRQAPVLMVPDSGAEALVVFVRNGTTALEVDEVDQLVGVSGVGSWRATRAAVLRELRVGTVTLRDQPAVVVEASGSRSVEGDGLLPLHRFPSVSFSNSEGYMLVAGAADPAGQVANARLREAGERMALGQAIRGAARQLADERCQGLLREFTDAAGRPLSVALESQSLSVHEHLDRVLFYDAPEHACKGRALAAIGEPGSLVIRVCGRRFNRAWAENARYAEAVIIHEMLHSLGLGENPPTSDYITSRVLSVCR
jgi:hypothetical protein